MWTNERLVDYATTYYRAYRERYEKRLEQAKQVIREAIQIVPVENCSVSWSGGKDSTVLAHIVRSMYPVDLMVLTDDLGTPGHVEYCQLIADRYGWEFTLVSPGFSIIEAMVKAGEGVNSSRKFDAWLASAGFFDVVARYASENNKKLTFLGLRGDESRGRMINRAKRGLLYQHKYTDTYIATPLGYWNVWDIWAYMVLNNIPVRDVYYADPARVRCGYDIPSMFRACRGALRDLKERNPGRFNELMRLFPDMREFV